MPIEAHARGIMVEMVKLMDEDKLKVMRERIDRAMLNQALNRVVAGVKGGAS